MAEIIDISEKKFGKLTAVKVSHSKNGLYWICRCDCGNEIVESGRRLRNGNRIECGKCKDMFHRSKDLTGKRFNRLMVISISHKTQTSKFFWKCKCDCGNNTIVNGISLIHGRTKSCGCLQKEKTSKLAFKHGKSGNRTYLSWNHMVQRCENKNNSQYKDYGGRGVTIDSSWRGDHGFENFFRDMGDRPNGKTLDRHPDKNGNYTKDNCRWATKKQQQRNTRSNVWIEAFGKLKLLIDWCEELEIQNGSIQRHLSLGRRFEDVYEFIMLNKNKEQKIKYKTFYASKIQ